MVLKNIMNELQKLRLDSTREFNENINLKAKKFNNISDEDLVLHTKKYLEHFYNFILNSKSSIKNEIMKCKLEIKIENIESIMLNFTSGSISTRNTDTPNKRITIDKNICLLLLSGSL